jgi:hypothetical protein
MGEHGASTAMHNCNKLFPFSTVLHPGSNRLPEMLHQAIVIKHSVLSTNVEMIGHALIRITPQCPPQSVFKATNNLGPGAWPLDTPNWTRSPEIAKAIQDGTALGITDEDYMKEKVTNMEQWHGYSKHTRTHPITVQDTATPAAPLWR